MIISDENEFIFVHIQRTAGTSIEKSLCHAMDVKNWRGFVGEPKNVVKKKSENSVPNVYDTGHRKKFEGEKHMTAKKLRKEVGKSKWNRYYTFSFVRNPWDRLVSIYLKRKKESQKIVKKVWPKNKILFNLAVIVKYGFFGQKRNSQMDYITDDNGGVIVDYIGKFENINEHFDHVCSKVGVDASLSNNKDSTDHKGYRKYYYDITKEIVRRHELGNDVPFNYKF